VGSHHIATALVQMGWEVAFISDPISPLHLLGGVDLARRFAYYRHDGIRFCEDRLWAYIPGALITPQNKPFLRSEWVSHSWQRFTFPKVASIVVQKGFDDVDLLYFDSFSQPFWLDAIRHRKSIFRIADRLTSYPKATSATPAILREMAQKVDAVVYSAITLQSYVDSLSPKNTVYIPNGVDFNRFSDRSYPTPPEYASITQPRAIYLGALDGWFDYKLLQSAAEQLPGVSFVLIGPDTLARSRLKELHNLYILGRRAHSEVPAYLSHADVGLIPFNVQGYPSLVNSVHPIKLYEYLACGLPVVAVEWDELRSLGSPAMLCRSAQEFVAAIKQAIEQPGNAEERVRFASQADWSKRVSSLLAALNIQS
jgi:glycosyltransferase involved in cell wall biosynthesis